MPYLSALEVYHDKVLYKSMLTFTFTLLSLSHEVTVFEHFSSCYTFAVTAAVTLQCH